MSDESAIIDDGLACPQCGRQGETEVKDSRPRLRAVRRRRKCNACGHRFTTFEVAVSDAEMPGFARLQELQASLLALPERRRWLIESLILDLQRKVTTT